MWLGSMSHLKVSLILDISDKQGWRQKFSDRGAGTSDRGAKMTEKWCFCALFCQISSDVNPKFPPTRGLDACGRGL